MAEPPAEGSAGNTGRHGAHLACRRWPHCACLLEVEAFAGAVGSCPVSALPTLPSQWCALPAAGAPWAHARRTGSATCLLHRALGSYGEP